MLRPKFLADECTFVQTVRLMQELGFQVERTQDLGMPPSPHGVRRVHEVLKRLLGNESHFEGTLFIVDANKYRKRSTK